MHPLESGLRQGLAELGLALDDAQIQRLLDYLDLIQKWTRVYNLTAVRNPAEMLTHHLLDSLSSILPLQQQLQARSLGGRAFCAGQGGARAAGGGHGAERSATLAT